MSKYNEADFSVGAIVTIREDIKLGAEQAYFIMTRPKSKYLGKSFKITRVIRDRGELAYNLNIPENPNWGWARSWLVEG